MGVVFGTAGHIDHGKSALVRTLTGMEPDRLAEERKRGITIELGYVFMPLPNGSQLAFIDVPGHEKFVRQMVAGVATVDHFILVVAADEGVMPQTREHMDIIKLLEINSGIVVITKCDLVDDEMQDLVEEDIREQLGDTPAGSAPVLRVSVTAGDGIEELKKTLISIASTTSEKNAGGKFRLDVDRVFKLRGFGVIVAGTAVSGTIKVGDVLELQPGGKTYRVREMSVNHERNVETGYAGDRIALNLVGLKENEVFKGSCLAEPGYLKAADSLDTECSLLNSGGILERNQRVRFHSGTAEVMARSIPVEDTVSSGMSGYVHFQMESPIVVLPGDRFVIRRYSPVESIGGGRILETGTLKVRMKYAEERKEHLQKIADGDISGVIDEKIRINGRDGFLMSDIPEETGISENELSVALDKMVEDKELFKMEDGSSKRYVSAAEVNAACDTVVDSLINHHEHSPVSPGIAVARIGNIVPGKPWFIKAILQLLLKSGRIEKREGWLALSEFPGGIADSLQETVDEYLQRAEEAGFRGYDRSGYKEEHIVNGLLERGCLFKLNEELLTTGRLVEKVRSEIISEFSESGFELRNLRDLLDVSRKFALLWAELLDALGHTVRRADRRYVID